MTEVATIEAATIEAERPLEEAEPVVARPPVPDPVPTPEPELAPPEAPVEAEAPPPAT